ncbi:MAG: phosphoribosyl-ATP diphosphatase [Candidatus Micrarchaeota archaeon]
MKNDEKVRELLPGIVQDAESGEVLSLFYFDRAALAKTLRTGRVWRYSRSQGKVMQKGATSGNTQCVESAAWDCDCDALLLNVRQAGAGACHFGKKSCFTPSKAQVLDEVYSVALGRKKKPRPGSYTSRIVRSRPAITTKLEEEMAEFVEAFNKKPRGEVVWEAADVLYFMLVALANRGIPVEKVFSELLRRRRKTRR